MGEKPTEYGLVFNLGNNGEAIGMFPRKKDPTHEEMMSRLNEVTQVPPERVNSASSVEVTYNISDQFGNTKTVTETGTLAEVDGLPSVVKTPDGATATLSRMRRLDD